MVLCLLGLITPLSALTATNEMCPPGEVLKRIFGSNHLNYHETPHSVQELLDTHHQGLKNGTIPRPKNVELEFSGGPKGRDLYNSPGEFNAKYKGEDGVFFAGREESAKSETDMKVAFYRKTGEGKYEYLNNENLIPHLALQDPAVAHTQASYSRRSTLCKKNAPKQNQLLTLNHNFNRIRGEPLPLTNS